VTPPTGRVRLVDAPEEAGRSTATLLASLTARLATLHLMSGADALGSLTAGLSRLGREVAGTAAGAQLRQALETGRAGMNGPALWSALRIDEWASSLPPSPVLDQLRNDLALLLADDLQPTLELLPIPAEPPHAGSAAEPMPATFADFTLGLWAFSLEVVRAIESMAAATMGSVPPVVAAAQAPPEREGELLR
jgi:hypothetical protein